MFIIKLTVLIFGTTGILWVSRSSLRDFHSHGFYRFFAWETILVLFVLNVNYWFIDPFSLSQIIAWIFLVISLLLIVLGVQSLWQKGKIDPERNDPALVGIEKTTSLVTSGVYRFIRHPFYSSLFFLAVGIMFKRISLVSLLLAVVAIAFLILTARKEEVLNVAYFGEKYQAYMRTTKMFIPYVL
jgi:protein-S-isoprenylcysteine O-methyltransferase Ste14